MHTFKVHFMMRLTYETFTSDEDDENNDIDEFMGDKADTAEHHGSESRNKVHWDDDCPWSEWYSAEDPLRGTSVEICFVFLHYSLHNTYLPLRFVFYLSVLKISSDVCVFRDYTTHIYNILSGLNRPLYSKIHSDDN